MENEIMSKEYVVVFEKNEGSKGCLLEHGKTPNGQYFPVVTKLLSTANGQSGEAEKRGVVRGDFLISLNGESMALEAGMELDDVLARIKTAVYPMKMTFSRFEGFDDSLVEDFLSGETDALYGTGDSGANSCNKLPMLKPEDFDEDNDVEDPEMPVVDDPDPSYVRGIVGRSGSLSTWPLFSENSPRLRGFSEDLASPTLLSMPPPGTRSQEVSSKQEQSSENSPLFRNTPNSTCYPMPSISLGSSALSNEDEDAYSDEYEYDDLGSPLSPTSGMGGPGQCAACQAAFPHFCRTHENMPLSHKSCAQYASCRFCSQDIHRKGLTRHQRYCKKNPNRGFAEAKSFMDHRGPVLYENCRYCGLRIHKSDLAAHHVSCEMQPSAEPTDQKQLSSGWSDYDSSHLDDFCRSPSPAKSKRQLSGSNPFQGHTHTSGTSTLRNMSLPSASELVASTSTHTQREESQEYRTVACNHCGVIYFNIDLPRHEQFCDKNPEAQLAWKYGRGNFAQCSHCGKGTHIKGAATHEKYCALNPERGMKRRRKEEADRRLYDPKLIGLCQWCGTEKHRKGLVRHEAYCENNPQRPDVLTAPCSAAALSVTCRHCGRSDLHPRGLGPHERFCPYNPTKPIPRLDEFPFDIGGTSVWNPPLAPSSGAGSLSEDFVSAGHSSGGRLPGYGGCRERDRTGSTADLLEDDGQLYSCRFCQLSNLGIHELTAHEQLCNHNPARSNLSPLARLPFPSSSLGFNSAQTGFSSVSSFFSKQSNFSTLSSYGSRGPKNIEPKRSVGDDRGLSSFVREYRPESHSKLLPASTFKKSVDAPKKTAGRVRSREQMMGGSIDADVTHIQCQHCGKMITQRGKDRHDIVCTANPSRHRSHQQKDLSSNEPLSGPCRFCGRMISWNDLTTHETHCDKNPMKGLRPPALYDRPRGFVTASGNISLVPPISSDLFSSDDDVGEVCRGTTFKARPRSGGIGGDNDVGAGFLPLAPTPKEPKLPPGPGPGKGRCRFCSSLQDTKDLSAHECACKMNPKRVPPRALKDPLAVCPDCHDFVAKDAIENHKKNHCAAKKSSSTPGDGAGSEERNEPHKTSKATVSLLEHTDELKNPHKFTIDDASENWETNKLCLDTPLEIFSSAPTFFDADPTKDTTHSTELLFQSDCFDAASPKLKVSGTTHKPAEHEVTSI